MNDAEAALVLLGAQLTWYESDDPTEFRGYTDSFDLYQVVGSGGFWAARFNDFDYPSDLGIDYDRDFQAGIYCARKLASATDAKAACERHYMTGRWQPTESVTGTNLPEHYPALEQQIPGYTPMFPPEPPPIPPPAVWLEWAEIEGESGFAAWAQQHNYYEVFEGDNGWRAAKDEFDRPWGCRGSLRCDTTFPTADDGKAACERHHLSPHRYASNTCERHYATGKWK